MFTWKANITALLYRGARQLAKDLRDRWCGARTPSGSGGGSLALGEETHGKCCCLAVTPSSRAPSLNAPSGRVASWVFWGEGSAPALRAPIPPPATGTLSSL